MKIEKSFKLAWNMLTHAKVRSWLTIVGIIIGIASVVAIVSISQGAEASLEENLASMGIDVLTITPGFSKAGSGGGFRRQMEAGTTSGTNQEPITKMDVLAIKSVLNIAFVMGTISGSGEIKYQTDSISKTITGVDASVWSEITNDELLEGRYLIKSDKNSIVIGDKLASETFDGIELNRQVTIEGRNFKVVGILESGNGIYMPIEQARIIIDDDDLDADEFQSISVKLENADDDDLYDDTLENLKNRLMMTRGILQEDDRDFTISDMKAMQENISETMGTMSLFLSAIAAISLLVGGIGIANTMFTSVLEKTKEIGIMKAIGAKNKDILSIFLLNSGMIGFVGGLGGVILGGFASVMINSMTSTSSGGGRGMTSMFSSSALSFELILMGLGFAIVIGMIAGAIPAYNASKLKPVDALRYE